MSVTGHQDTGALKNPQDRLQYAAESVGVSKSVAKRFAKNFLDHVPVRKLSGDHFLTGGIEQAAKADLLDTEFARLALSKYVANTVGGYEIGDQLTLQVIDSALGMVAFTNIDFEAMNRRRATATPPVEPLTIAHALTGVLEARADVALASFYGGDFVTSTINSLIIRVRFAELLRRKNINFDSRKQFTELVLPDSPSLAAVVDSGERTLSEFLILLDQAIKFKDWLGKVNPDEELIRTYLRDITKKGWIERLPVKTLRYVFSAAIDASNPIAGLAAGLVDNFLLDKLFSGWRPNHFVDSRLSPFVRGY